jgi:hypothetical protein
MFDVAAVLTAKGWSDRHAGEEVLARWRQLEKRGEYPKAASIGVKVGRLKKGKKHDDTWWRGHGQRHALAALAELLQCKPQDLLGGRVPLEAIGFAEFPELGVILPGQEACALRRDGWLGSFARRAMQQSKSAWIVAPPGAGKSLAIRVLGQEEDRWAAITARTLHGALRGVDPHRPLLVEVERAEPASDDIALADVAKRPAHVCVLSAYLPPALQGPRGRMCADWRPDPGWQESFVRWAKGRLDQPERLDVQDILEWLGVVDPRGNLFSTPGDLLPLLARAYRAGLPLQREGLQGLAEEWMARTLGSSSNAWLRWVGSAAVKALLAQRLASTGVALAPLSVDAWAKLLPTSLAPADVTEAPSRSKRVKKDEGRREPPSQGSPLEAVGALCDVGALRTGENGGLDVFPAWLRVAVERDVIGRAVKEGAVDNWALASVDDTRRSAVDDALDALAPFDLVKASTKVLASESSDLSSVAAAEALFAAIGRRLMSGWNPAAEMVPTLQRLGLRQLELVDRFPKVGELLALPLTRRRTLDADPWMRWQATCRAEAWTFSFEVNRPQTVRVEAGWTLPGWASGVRLASAPPLPSLRNKDSLDPTMVRGLLKAARRVLAACGDAAVPTEVSDIFLPWVAIDGEAHGWRLEKSFGQLLLNRAGLADCIADLLREEPIESRARFAVRVWPALAAAESHPIFGLRRLRDEHWPLFDLLAAHWPLDVVVDALAADPITHLTDLGAIATTFPPNLRRAVLLAVARRLRDSGSHQFGELEPVVGHLGLEDLDVLIEFASHKYALGAAAVRHVWALDPERAFAEASRSLKAKDDAASLWWFHWAPPAWRTRLLDLLREHASDVSWAARWLADSLPVAGPQAPRVFTMMLALIASAEPVRS